MGASTYLDLESNTRLAGRRLPLLLYYYLLLVRGTLV